MVTINQPSFAGVLAIDGQLRSAWIRVASAGEALTAVQVQDRILKWEQLFQAYQSDNTVKAVRADLNVYGSWCISRRYEAIPASPRQVKDFVDWAVQQGRKLSSVKRYLYTIKLIHEAAGLPSPTSHPDWKPLWRETLKNNTLKGRQATPLGIAAVELLADVLTFEPKHKRDLRDAALLALASDTLMRESELVAVQVEHFATDDSTGNHSVFLPCSKADQRDVGGDYRYVDAWTMELVQAWMRAAEITEGPVFRPIGGRKRNKTKEAEAQGLPPPILALNPKEVAKIFRRRAVQLGLPSGHTITGHSTRVGSAIDLDRQNVSTIRIQEVGGWKSPEMVCRYTKRPEAGRNTMATLRAKQHRRKD